MSKMKKVIMVVESSRFKSRLAKKGFLQKEGIGYHEVFVPIIKQK